MSKFKCDFPGCDKEFDAAIALSGHQRSHKKESEPVQVKAEGPVNKMVEIMIHHQEGEAEYVPVNILGKDVKINPHWLIQRGKWEKVPEIVLQSLNEAVIETDEYLPKDDNTPGSFSVRKISMPRFAVSSRPVQAEG